MTLRDMTPDELEMFEEEIVQDREPSQRREEAPEVAWDKDADRLEKDADRDGLLDGSVDRRVPS